MYFSIPTKLIQERNAVKKGAQHFKGVGSHALLVTGKHSAVASGAQKDVTDVLDSLGIPYDVFSQVEENPSLDIELDRHCGKGSLLWAGKRS